jgi:phosphoesterase RecJ-like protein
MNTLTEIANLLRRGGRVLAVSHVAPDGDAIGSLLGFGWVLRSANPDGFSPLASKLTLACADPVPAQFQWLPGASEIISAPPAGPWDAIVGLDASDGARLGSPFRPAEFGAAPIVIIDHHITNLQFGTLNYVDPAAVATSQIVVDLADALSAPIVREAATCLLTGLVTDTLGFRTSNVTPQVMAVAMRLMEAGANLAEITERTLNHKPLNTLRLWGQALANLQINGRVVWAAITRQMRAQVDASLNGDGGLVSQLINAPEAVIAAVFSETAEGKIEIGFRAKSGYDVSQIALNLGGGGHPQASGCTIAGPLADAEARVLPMLLQVAG